MEDALDAGASDFTADGDLYVVTTETATRFMP